MKRLILLSIACTVLIQGSFAQTLSDLDTNKYRIRLPSHWKPGNKIWGILTDKLPGVCEEIREKELCGDDCNPKYTIELEVYEPLATRYDYYCTNLVVNVPDRKWIFITYYNFESSLLVLNEKRELLGKIILVDTSEIFYTRNEKSYKLRMESDFASRSAFHPVSLGPGRYILPRRSSTLLPQYKDDFNPQSFLAVNKERLMPSDRELFEIIEKRIRNW